MILYLKLSIDPESHVAMAAVVSNQSNQACGPRFVGNMLLLR